MSAARAAFGAVRRVAQKGTQVRQMSGHSQAEAEGAHGDLAVCLHHCPERPYFPALRPRARNPIVQITLFAFLFIRPPSFTALQPR